MEFWQGLRRDYPAAVYGMVILAVCLISLSFQFYKERQEWKEEKRALQAKVRQEEQYGDR